MKKLLEESGIIKTGHFKLTSGRHSNQYINKDAIYSNPKLFGIITLKMGDKIYPFKDLFDVVTGPAIAGAVLAAPISLEFTNKIFVYPEKINDEMVFRRGYGRILKDKKVWIVEDIITTGGSIKKTISAIEKCGGKVVGISAIWDRGKGYIDGYTILSLINEFVPSYAPEECPDCKKGKPLQNPKEE